MTALMIALVTAGLLAHILYVVLTDDPSRRRGSRTPPRSHAPDEFEPDAFHRAA